MDTPETTPSTRAAHELRVVLAALVVALALLTAFTLGVVVGRLVAPERSVTWAPGPVHLYVPPYASPGPVPASPLTPGSGSVGSGPLSPAPAASLGV